MIYSWSQENSFPLKWYFSWVLSLQSSSGLGIYVSLLHVFFSGFHYYMTNRSPQSTAPASQRGCPCSENCAAPQLRIDALSRPKSWAVSPLNRGLPHPKKGLWEEQWGAVAPLVGNVHSLYTDDFLKSKPRDGLMIKWSTRQPVSRQRKKS